MESVLGRYRNLIILVGVLFLQVIGLAVQVKRGATDGQDTRLIRVWAVGAVTPFERLLVWMRNSTGDIWHNYFYLRGVRAENRQLKEQIEQMRLEEVRLSEAAAQAHRLQSLLAFKEQFVAKTVAAQVIGSSGVDSSRVIYIDKGENAGITRDMAVITSDGIVGKVLLVYPSLSQVLLINDQTSGVGVLLANSRLQGVLVGMPNGETAVNGIMSDEQVPLGESVLTSGGDQIFPKGLPVGTVSKVGIGKDLFLGIRIKPAANLSKLEEVLVVVEKQERQATADSNTRVRAADILAQRLPSVPEKPAAAKPSTGNATATAKPAAHSTNVTGTPSSTTVTGTKPDGTSGPPASKTVSATPNAQSTEAGTTSAAGPHVTPKPKTAETTPVPTAKQGVALEPAATGQKPAAPTPVQPNPPPPADQSSPQ